MQSELTVADAGVIQAGLYVDEGLLPLYLPVLIYMENPYR